MPTPTAFETSLSITVPIDISVTVIPCWVVPLTRSPMISVIEEWVVIPSIPPTIVQPSTMLIPIPML